MQSLEFLLFLLDNLLEFTVINICTFIILFFFIKRILFAGMLDPLFFILVVGFSTKYAIVFFLYFNGLVTNFLFLMVVSYCSIFIISFTFFSSSKYKSIFVTLINSIAKHSNGIYEYRFCLFIYLIIALFILSNIGFGVFAQTNRFENSRGFGAFVRVLDLLSVFIIAHSAILISRVNRFSNKILFSILLLLFIILSALINGAKISILFGLMTALFAIQLTYKGSKVSIKNLVFMIGFGVMFMFFALKINMSNNGEDISSSSKNIVGASLVQEKFINRMVSNGNTAYLILPNDIIDELKTDNIFIRILTPVIGITQMSKVVGYNAGDYSVGRQSLLYHHGDVTVAGGPTSHFDFFSYVYLGVIGGAFFVFFIGSLLGNLHNAIKVHNNKNNKNDFLTTLYTVFWFRAVIILVEPSVGFAYIFDAFVILFSIAIAVLILKRIS